MEKASEKPRRSALPLLDLRKTNFVASHGCRLSVTGDYTFNGSVTCQSELARNIACLPARHASLGRTDTDMAHNTTLVHPGAMVLVDDPEPWPGRVIGPGDTPNEVRVRRRVLGVMTEHIVDVRRVFRHQDEPMRFMPLNLTAAFEVGGEPQTAASPSSPQVSVPQGVPLVNVTPVPTDVVQGVPIVTGSRAQHPRTLAIRTWQVVGIGDEDEEAAN